MKITKKEKKNFNFTIGLVQEFNDRCVPEGSNASVEIERLLRAELRRQDAKNEIVDYLFATQQTDSKIPTIQKIMRGMNLLEQFETKVNDGSPL